LPIAEESSPFGDALPLQDFRKDLEREKRRSDRCKAPLSLALYQLDDDARRTVAFLEVVQRVTRETDVVGHVGNDRIALLCPDTDSSGIRSALRKIEAAAQGLDVKAIAVVTHPDMLFDRISAGELASDPTAPLQEVPRRRSASHPPSSSTAGAQAARLRIEAGHRRDRCGRSDHPAFAGDASGCTGRGTDLARADHLQADAAGSRRRAVHFFKFRSMASGGDDRIHRAYVASLIDGRPDSVRVPAKQGSGSTSSRPTRASRRWVDSSQDQHRRVAAALQRPEG
jgi:GGDEF domain-containing protein